MLSFYIGKLATFFCLAFRILSYQKEIKKYRTETS